jgi:hypothetical protein
MSPQKKPTVEGKRQKNQRGLTLPFKIRYKISLFWIFRMRKMFKIKRRHMVIIVFGGQQPEAVFKEKHGIWDTMPELTKTHLIS